MILAAQKVNSGTIRDASLLSSADDFSEEFAEYLVISLPDFFSEYDQVALHQELRDLKTFQTEFGLVKLTTVPREYTNSIQLFNRVIRKIL